MAGTGASKRLDSAREGRIHTGVASSSRGEGPRPRNRDRVTRNDLPARIDWSAGFRTGHAQAARSAALLHLRKISGGNL